MLTFDPQEEHILSLISAGKDVRQMLAAYQILDYKSFKQLDKKKLLDMTRNVNDIPTKLFPCKVEQLLNCIKYIRFHEANNDNDLAADPTS